jgi:hypothetical protein
VAVDSRPCTDGRVLIGYSRGGVCDALCTVRAVASLVGRVEAGCEVHR